jgi:hypothetical protein
MLLLITISRNGIMVVLGDKPNTRQCPQCARTVIAPRALVGLILTGVRLMVLSSEIPSTMVQQAYSIAPHVYEIEMWKHLLVGFCIGAVAVWLIFVAAAIIIEINDWTRE